MNKLLLVLICIICFSSCRKCISCEVRDSAGNIIMPAKQTCGTEEQLEEARLVASTKAVLISNGSYTCVDEK